MEFNMDQYKEEIKRELYGINDMESLKSIYTSVAELLEENSSDTEQNETGEN